MPVLGNDNRPKIWQDIIPASSLPKPQKTKFFSRFKKTSAKHLNLVVKKPKKRISKKRLIIRLIIVAICLILACVGYKLLIIDKAKGTSDNTKTTYTAEDLTKGMPNYSTVLPAGKTISELGGWTRVSPSDSDEVYTFIDTINGVTVRVSEQPLPDNLKTDTANQIENMANNINATSKITVGNIIAYIGTSANGPQSVIFAKNDILILITSTTVISNDHWANYINSLQ